MSVMKYAQVSSFSWQKYSAGELLRKVRLDRTYVSNEICSSHNRAECIIDHTTCLSDHCPIISTIDDQDNKNKACWFHTDPTLFKLPIVKEEIHNIGRHFLIKTSPLPKPGPWPPNQHKICYHKSEKKSQLTDSTGWKYFKDN